MIMVPRPARVNPTAIRLLSEAFGIGQPVRIAQAIIVDDLCLRTASVIEPKVRSLQPFSRDYAREHRVENHWKTYGAAGRGDAKTVHRRLPCIPTILGRHKRCGSARSWPRGHFVESRSAGQRFNEAEYQRVFRSMEQDRVDALMIPEITGGYSTSTTPDVVCEVTNRMRW